LTEGTSVDRRLVLNKEGMMRGSRHRVSSATGRFVVYLAVVVGLALGSGEAAAYSNLTRLGDASGEVVSTIASVPIGHDRVVTATRGTDGTLTVSQWRVEKSGAVTKIGSSTAGQVSRVAVAALGDGQVVTAVRTEGGNLKLIAWRTPEDGSVTRFGDTEAGAISEVAIVGHREFRVVTAVRQSDGTLKLISWHLSPSGGFERLGSAAAGEISEVALVEYAPLRFASAVRDGSGSLKLIAWEMDAAGKLARLGDAAGDPLSAIDAALLSHQRVVVAGKNPSGELSVSTWDLTTTGTITRRATTSAGKVSAISIASLAAAHPVAAVREHGGTLKLIHWDGIGALSRLGDASAGDVTAVSLDVLGDYRLVTSVRDAAGRLKVIAWNEHAVTLLRSRWNVTSRFMATPQIREVIALEAVASAKEPTEERQPSIVDFDRRDYRAVHVPIPGALDLEGSVALADQSPAFNLSFEPGVESAGWDPMIAVGFDFIIVSQDHEIGFFDKQGNQLPSKHGEPTQMSATEFFSGFLASTDAQGELNEHSVNRHLGFPSVDPSAGSCDPTAPWPSPSPCIREFYDTRAIFDPQTRRFVILSAGRPSGVSYAKDGTLKATDPLVRRYVAFAVSRTEDPRDGFYQYMSTESNYSDWPRVAVAGGMLVVAYNSKQSSRDGVKPVVYLYPMDELAQGATHPSAQKTYPSATGGSVIPVTPYGADPGWIFLVRPNGKTLHVFAFRPPSDIRVPVELEESTVQFSEDLGFLRVGALYRNGRIYFTFPKVVTPRVANGKNGRQSVRVVRVPIVDLATTPRASGSAGDGFLDTFFGRSAPEDAPGDLVSYEEPSIAVTGDGDMVLVYGRVGHETQTDLFPEVRYSVYYADSRGLKRSRLLAAGNHMPTDVKSDETAQTITTPDNRMDHSCAVADPADAGAVWIIHEYADSARGQNPTSMDGYRTVVGRVRP
jgi:hypothetical protein